MSVKRKVFTIILSVLLGLSLIFVWGQSLLPASTETDKADVIINVGLNSHDQSEAVYEATKGAVDAVFGKGKIELPHFRKLAHIAEYIVVSLIFNLLLLTLNRYKAHSVFWSLSSGLFIAVIDESLQIISKRGPEIYDVLVDFLGVATVSIIFLGIILLAKFIKHKKLKKEVLNEKE